MCLMNPFCRHASRIIGKDFSAIVREQHLLRSTRTGLLTLLPHALQQKTAIQLQSVPEESRLQRLESLVSYQCS